MRTQLRTAVVAGGDEWRRAQNDKGFKNELLGRIESRFAPLTYIYIRLCVLIFIYIYIYSYEFVYI